MSEKQVNAGIDYGMGVSNVDKSNGIRYGVISSHSIMPECLDDAEYDYGPASCPKCGDAAIEIPSHTESSVPPGSWVSVIQDVPDKYEEYETAKHECADYACETCEYLFGSESAFSDEAHGWSIDDGEYMLTDCLDSNVFVIKSPYYTYAQFCSPCVPGAGNLDHPLDFPLDPDPLGLNTLNGAPSLPRVYALGHEWFEDERAPYRVFRVTDDSEVIGGEVTA